MNRRIVYGLFFRGGRSINWRTTIGCDIGPPSTSCNMYVASIETNLIAVNMKKRPGNPQPASPYSLSRGLLGVHPEGTAKPATLGRARRAERASTPARHRISENRREFGGRITKSPARAAAVGFSPNADRAPCRPPLRP